MSIKYKEQFKTKPLMNQCRTDASDKFRTRKMQASRYAINFQLNVTWRVGRSRNACNGMIR